MSLARRRAAAVLVLVLTAAGASVPTATAEPPRAGASAAGGSQPFPEEIPLPAGSLPEGIADGPGTTFFAGSRVDGSVYRGDVRTGDGEVVVPGVAGRVAVGMRYDERTHRLWVAGGPTGAVTVYDARTGEELGRWVVPGSGFLNDVEVTPDAVYVTDSAVQRLVVVPLGPRGQLPGEGGARTLPLTGELRYGPGFNLNGIRALPGRAGLVAVQSSTGDLYRIDPCTGSTERLPLSGPDLTARARRTPRWTGTGRAARAGAAVDLDRMTRPDARSTPLTAPPQEPDPAHLTALRRATESAAARATPLVSTCTGAPADLLDAAEDAVGVLAPDLLALSHDLHAHPEEGWAEHRSVRALADLLAAHGVAAQVGAHGLDTALRARTGSGAPVVAVLAEYDALPGIGHACGHNVIAASAAGAFLALHRVLGDGGRGTAVLLGTPAEEGGGGKELLARAGALDGVDAAVMLHPFGYDVAVQPFLGRRQVRAVYTGVAAHAAAQPFMGRNALDAVVAGYQGIAMLRQHIPASDRVHGIVLEGGLRPNVVPERASAEYYVRSAQPETLVDLCSRVEAVLVAAAAMTGCGHEITWDAQPAYLPVRANLELAARWTLHQRRRGRTALPPGVVPESLTGSTDLGNLSVRVPAIHPMIAIAGPETSLHTSDFAAAAVSEAGDRAVVDGAVGLALTALDVLTDAGLLAAVRAEFEAAGGVLDVAAFGS